MLKTMTSFILICITLFLLNTQYVLAEPITIDPEQASYDEIVEAIDKLNTERINRLKEQFKTEYTTTEDKDSFSFRGVPFLTLKPDADSILGTAESYITSHINSPNSNSGLDPLGVVGYYNDVPVAGYVADTMTISYVYPVMDGLLIHDNDLAIFYSAYYRILVEDVESAAQDITDKLSNLYGECKFNDGRPIWYDKASNYIMVRKYIGFFDIYYTSVDAEQLLSEAKDAYFNEKAQEEAEKRIQEQSNVDGL